MRGAAPVEPSLQICGNFSLKQFFVFCYILGHAILVPQEYCEILEMFSTDFGVTPNRDINWHDDHVLNVKRLIAVFFCEFFNCVHALSCKEGMQLHCWNPWSVIHVVRVLSDECNDGACVMKTTCDNSGWLSYINRTYGSTKIAYTISIVCEKKPQIH